MDRSNKRGKRKIRRGLDIRSIVIIVLAAALIAVSVLFAVTKTKDNRTIETLRAQTVSAPAEDFASPAAQDPNAVAAEFDGGTVTVGEVWDNYRTVASFYEMSGIPESEYAEQTKKEVLDGAVEEKLTEIKARELGVWDLDESQTAEARDRADPQFNSLVEYYMGYRFDDGGSDAELYEETVAYLAENGITYESVLNGVIDEMRSDALYRRVTEDFTLTEEDVRAYYDQKLESDSMSFGADYSAYETAIELGEVITWNPEGVRGVQAILIPFNEEQIGRYLTLLDELESGDADRLGEIDALYAELDGETDAVLARLAAGEDFTLVMDECGADVNMLMSDTRTEGYRISKDSTYFSEEFVSAAMGLENIGDISEPVRADSGIYILRYACDIPAGAIPYEQVKDDIRELSEEEIRREYYNRTVDGWLENAHIVYHYDVFK